MRRRFHFKKTGKCFFCQEKLVPDFTQIEILRKFVSERGRILVSARTGTCTAHQRGLKKAVKRARFLSLIPFAAKI